MMDKVEVIEELSDIPIRGIGTEVSGPDTSPPKSDKHKVDILLKATGNAPIMKKKKWAVDPDKPIGWIIEFIRKYLKLDPADSLPSAVSCRSAPKKPWGYCKLDTADSMVSWLQYCNVTVIVRYPMLQFLYVNQSFAPSPDQIVRNLYDCYGTDGKLILHYCKSQAWG
uniref:Ubiquitin-like protein ATG12 n=1 Tax=Timema monikensis TaxID=170555 RepID=A0A7R9E7F6_9NEOP|nr:unnamed protein product [Timema monikensis]